MRYFQPFYKRTANCGCGGEGSGKIPGEKIPIVLGIFEDFDDAKVALRKAIGDSIDYAKDIYKACYVGKKGHRSRHRKEVIAALMRGDEGAEAKFLWARAGKLRCGDFGPNQQRVWYEKWIDGFSGSVRVAEEPGCCSSNHEWTIEEVEVDTTLHEQGPLTLFVVAKSDFVSASDVPGYMCLKPGSVVGFFRDWLSAKKALREEMREHTWLLEACALRYDTDFFEADVEALMSGKEGAEAQFDWSRLSGKDGFWKEKWADGQSADLEGTYIVDGVKWRLFFNILTVTIKTGPRSPVHLLKTMLYHPLATHSDTVIVSGTGNRFSVHSSVLGAASPFLSALLGSDQWRENADGNDKVVQLPQPSQVVEMWLRFLYTGVVDSLVCLRHTMDVLDLAAQHGLSALTNACEEHVATFLLPEFTDCMHRLDMELLHSSCPRLIEAARLHGLTSLEAAAFTFKAKRDAAVVQTDEVVTLLGNFFQTLEFREFMIADLTRRAIIDPVTGLVTFSNPNEDPAHVAEEAAEAPNAAEAAVEAAVEAHEPVEAAVEAHGPVEAAVEAHGPVEAAVEAHGPVEAAVEAHGPVEAAVEAHEPVEAAVEAHEPVEGGEGDA